MSADLARPATPSRSNANQLAERQREGQRHLGARDHGLLLVPEPHPHVISPNQRRHVAKALGDLAMNTVSLRVEPQDRHTTRPEWVLDPLGHGTRT
jgi:hypothetical protein